MKRALLLAGALFALSCTTGSAVADDRPRVVSVIRDARISESSGLALSTRQPGLVYTVNDEPRMRELAALGVDGIFTDRPAALREVLRPQG